jgi:hypothetical protein
LNWFLTAILSIILVEFAIRLPFVVVVTEIIKASGKAVHIIRAKTISDHWKEKALAAYAEIIFCHSMKLAGLLIVLLGIAAAPVVILERISGGFASFLLGWTGIGFSIIFAGLYLKARKSVASGRV